MYEMYRENRKLLTDAECYELRDTIRNTAQYSTAHYAAVRELRMEIPSSDNEFLIRTTSEEKKHIYLIKRSVWNHVINTYSEFISMEDCRKILSLDLEWMKNSSRTIIQELYYQMEYNQCEFGHIIEYLQEVYTNPYVGERIVINVLEKHSTNMISEFFEPHLSYYPLSRKKSCIVICQKSLAVSIMALQQKNAYF